MKEIDHIVIGAGVSGLMTSALLSKESSSVLVLERHTTLGGCAGYFERDGKVYNVGATTLSGVSAGRPLNDFLERFPHIKLNYTQPKVSQTIHHSKKIFLYRNQEAWVNHLKNHHDASQKEIKAWNQINQIDHKIFSFLKKFRYPIITFSNLKEVLSFIPWLISFLRPTNFTFFQYKKAIDEQLLVSTQNTSRNISQGIASIGLNYPRDMVHLKRGMFDFIDYLKRIQTSETQILTTTAVKKIIKLKDGFEVVTNKGSFKAKNVYSTLPIWNISKLASHFIPKLHKWSQKNSLSWGAMTAYFDVDIHETLSSYYHQIILESPLSLSKSESIFVSFYQSTESLNEYQVTVSTHIRPEILKRGVDYKKHKEQFSLEVRKAIERNFKSATIKGPITVGTPQTFKRFTGRHNGNVGGLIHQNGFYFLKWPQVFTSDPNFFLLGDTTLPGQSVNSLALGAMKLTDYLKRENKI